MRQNIAAVALIVLLVGCTSHPPRAEETVSVRAAAIAQEAQAGATAPGEIATVFEVYDGDTLRVQFPNGTLETVRIIGIDAPEIKGKYTLRTNPYGRRAQTYLASLVRGETVRLEREVRNRDGYHRLLRHIFVERHGGVINVAEAMLVAGFATAAPWEPDTQHAEHFATLEEEARAAHRGRWHSRKKKVALRSMLPRRFFLQKRSFFGTIVE